jgi:hypothetical protein
MTTAVLIDEAGADWNLARVSWRSSEQDPWRTMSEYGLKTAGELRELIKTAIDAGKTKYPFYKLDPGKPRPQAEAIPGQRIKGVNHMGNPTTVGNPVANHEPNPEIKKAIQEAKAKTKAPKKVKEPKAAKVAKPKVEKAPKAKKEPKANAPKKERAHKDWFVVQDEVTTKKARGPYASIAKASDSIGTMGDDIHPGREANGIYRRIKGERRRDVKGDAKPKVISKWLIMAADTLVAQGYQLPDDYKSGKKD